MATSQGPVKIEKRRLKNTPMYVNRIQETRASSFNLKVRIEGFSLMERYRKYVNDIPDLNWTLQSFLDNENLTLTFFITECNKKMQSFLMFQDRLEPHRSYYPVKEIEEGKYQSRFPVRSIVVKENTFLKSDYVTIVFEIEKDKNCITSLRPIIGARTERSANKIHKDLKKAAKRNDVTDFVIVARNEKVYFHKGIVASRSELFRSENFKKVENKETTELELNTEITALRSVRHYMYTGVVPSLSLDHLIEALNLSITLNIPKLYDMCLVAINACMNLDNAMYVLEKGVKSKLTELTIIAHQFIDNYKNPEWNSATFD